MLCVIISSTGQYELLIYSETRNLVVVLQTILVQ